MNRISGTGFSISGKFINDAADSVFQNFDYLRTDKPPPTKFCGNEFFSGIFNSSIKYAIAVQFLKRKV